MKKLITVMLVMSLFVSMFGGCAKNTSDNQEGGADEIPYLEVWYTNLGFLEVKEDGPESQFFIDNVGVGVYSPYVPWEGGAAYIQKLNTKIASGELPDVFLPWLGVENTLIEQGAVAELSEYLPTYAPNVWESVPEHVWDIVRTADPSGEGGIYYIPSVKLFNNYGGFIRQDWLDRVGKEIPTTKEEFVDVLRAFKAQDANGNGDPNDEIPIAGRELGRWMDYLFAMYGVAMWEGYPMWDMYDGELTYSAVTDNMRDALIFINELYEEGLLDSETFLNSGSDWVAKIQSDKLGVWYHLPQHARNRFEPINSVNPEAKFSAMPIISADGYDGFITHVDLDRPEWVIANKDEDTIINALKLIDFSYNPENREINKYRVEGINHEIVDGKKVLIPSEKTTHENIIFESPIMTADDLYLANDFLRTSMSEDRVWVIDAAEEVQKALQGQEKRIAGDGMPKSVYNDYPDLEQHTMYQEYIANIIIGTWPIEKFDEFVEIWYQSGGDVITERAREWYSLLEK